MGGGRQKGAVGKSEEEIWKGEVATPASKQKMWRLELFFLHFLRLVQV